MIRRARRPLAAGISLVPVFGWVALATGGGQGPRARDLARRHAEDILAERRFQKPDLPSPFRDPLRWIGQRAQDVLGAIFGPIGSLPAGLGWLLLGGVVVAVVTVAARLLARSRAVAATSHAESASRTAALSPEDLEREADACEAHGDLRRAVRLRFRAGLLRLAADGVIPRAQAITSGEVARRAASPTFPRVARSFDEIVYGDRPPGDDDADLSRDGWRAVRAEVAAGPRGEE